MAITLPRSRQAWRGRVVWYHDHFFVGSTRHVESSGDTEMLDKKTRRTSFVLASSLGLLLAFLAGKAAAEGDKFDEAKVSTAKAIAALREAGDDKAPRDAHRKKAIDLLTRAQSEILKAKGE
jgi:hypothetical protein